MLEPRVNTLLGAQLGTEDARAVACCHAPSLLGISSLVGGIGRTNRGASQTGISRALGILGAPAPPAQPKKKQLKQRTTHNTNPSGLNGGNTKIPTTGKDKHLEKRVICFRFRSESNVENTFSPRVSEPRRWASSSIPRTPGVKVWALRSKAHSLSWTFLLVGGEDHVSGKHTVWRFFGKSSQEVRRRVAHFSHGLKKLELFLVSPSAATKLTSGSFSRIPGHASGSGEFPRAPANRGRRRRHPRGVRGWRGLEAAGSPGRARRVRRAGGALPGSRCRRPWVA